VTTDKNQLLDFLRPNKIKAETVALLFRVPLAMWLCWAIYEETGPYTSFGFFLVFISIEFITAYIRKANKLAGEAIRKLKI